MDSYCYYNQEKVALILEYGTGGTLREYLKLKKRFSEVEARRIFAQILKAIHYCHRNQIIHRDLKLENIIFADSEKNRVKIIDFGVAGLFQGEINKAGSISYMAPEVVGGWNYSSQPEIDIWSLGCILYELITGETLFDGESVEDKKDKILKGKFVFARTISNEAAHLINKMIKTKATERISIKDCFLHAWIIGATLSEQELKENDNSSIAVSSSFNSFRLRSTSTNFLLSELPSPQTKMNLSTIKVAKSENSVNNDFNFNTYLRSNNSDKKLNKINKLGLITKVTKNVSLFDLQYGIMKNNGKVISHLQPIGHTKQQKQQTERIRDILYKTSSEDYKIKQSQQEQTLPKNQLTKEKSLNKLRSSKIVFPQLIYNKLIENSNSNNDFAKVPSRRYTSQFEKSKHKTIIGSPNGNRQGSVLSYSSSSNIIKFGLNK